MFQGRVNAAQEPENTRAERCSPRPPSRIEKIFIVVSCDIRRFSAVSRPKRDCRRHTTLKSIYTETRKDGIISRHRGIRCFKGVFIRLLRRTAAMLQSPLLSLRGKGAGCSVRFRGRDAIAQRRIAAESSLFAEFPCRFAPLRLFPLNLAHYCHSTTRKTYANNKKDNKQKTKEV